MENKHFNFLGEIPSIIFAAFIGLAAIFAAGGLVILSFRWLMSLIKGGF